MATPSRKLVVPGAALAVLLLCLGLSWETRDALNQAAALEHAGSGGNDARQPLVDQRPWRTAQDLAPMAVTAEEIQFAREAERLADHEVDQAFAGALREATLERHTLKGEALQLSQKVEQLKQVVQEDQARVSAMEAAGSKGSAKTDASAPEASATDLDVAKAQLALDSDELADAQQDLARASGDKRSRIQEELAAHEAAMRKYDQESRAAGEVATVSAEREASMAERLRAWFDQNARYRLLGIGMRQAQAEAAVLTATHNGLQGEETRRSAREGQIGQAGLASTKGDQLARLHAKSTQRQLFTIYDDRIQTERQLATVYGKWAEQVSFEHRITQHLIFLSLALISFIVLCVVGLDRLATRFRDRAGLDRRRRHTLSVILKLAIQVTGLVLILFVIFGAPRQMPTILGLTTAGLTVVLQDFIIAIVGWFILMGPNGIRMGDWVEINGVGGEVTEVGLFRTALHEMGNWTDKGHPTGRRVTFINSFAIKGQFFNFSTTGQWMWDEITVSIPAGGDSYATIQRIRETVLKETESDTRLAEEEWRRATQQNNAALSRFSADPAVDMRPGVSGIDVIVRYVTRASHRYDMKNRLYNCLINLLHHAAIPEVDAPANAPS